MKQASARVNDSYEFLGPSTTGSKPDQVYAAPLVDYSQRFMTRDQIRQVSMELGLNKEASPKRLVGMNSPQKVEKSKFK